jgi:hypothetical protein
LIAITCRLYITSVTSRLGKWCCSSTTSFHFVPTLERTTREGTPPGKSSPFVHQRGILCGYFIVILHSTVNRRETFVASFAPSRLRHPLPPMKSKALTSKFRDQAVFVRAVVIVVLTAQLLQPGPRVPKARPRPDVADYLRLPAGGLPLRDRKRS